MGHVLDQFGTPLAYHGVPESHMKTVVVAPKCERPKVLAKPYLLNMVNLDQVQVADLEIALSFSDSTCEQGIKNDLRSDVRQDWWLEPGQPRGKGLASAGRAPGHASPPSSGVPMKAASL
jgi:hypothetical protein